jgi:hypothetical protein
MPIEDMRQVAMEKRKWHETRVAVVIMDGWWRWGDEVMPTRRLMANATNVEVETCLDIFVVCRDSAYD